MYLTASLCLMQCLVAIETCTLRATMELGSWEQTIDQSRGAHVDKRPAARTRADMRSTQIYRLSVYSPIIVARNGLHEAGLSKPSCTAARESADWLTKR
jgi:hypothetical protein